MTSITIVINWYWTLKSTCVQLPAPSMNTNGKYKTYCRNSKIYKNPLRYMIIQYTCGLRTNDTTTQLKNSL